MEKVPISDCGGLSEPYFSFFLTKSQFMNKYNVITNKYILGSVPVKSLTISDSGWGSWNSWSSCLKTCGEDVKKIRYRSCENPDPKYGGRDCPGENYKYGLCSPQPEICRTPNATCNSGKVFL